MLSVFPSVENHLRKVMTNSISSVRHIICTQHSRRERDFVRKHLFSEFAYPVTDVLQDDFNDIIAGMFLPPDQRWSDDRSERMDYLENVLLPEAYVKFVMEVEGMTRHIAEEILFNWTEQLPKLLMQLKKK